MRVVALAFAFGLLGAPHAFAQAVRACRVLCTPEFNIEPTVTFSNLFGSPRIATEDGTTMREPRKREFEIIFAVGLPTRLSWLEFTAEAIVLPFDRDSTPELEFEMNVLWLPPERTGGWVSSHFDIVDKFSGAERERVGVGAYTHKLNFELDTSLSVFNWVPAGRWLRGVELEGSLDYVATGLARKGDSNNGVRYLDNASPWSFSVVFVLPIAPS